jgi:hypothetical protein
MPPDPEVRRVKDPSETLNARVLARMQDPGTDRLVILGMAGTAVAVTTLAAVILTVIFLTSSADLADRMAEAGVVFAGATLLLAAIAAIVALLAYAVSTGPPNLRLNFNFAFSSPNNPKFEADLQDDGRLKAKRFKQISAAILLRNDSGYSAKNPAVILRLHAMVFLPDMQIDPVLELSPDFRGPQGAWTVIDSASTNGIIAMQWDGGPAYSIHGHSTRRLPDLRLDNLWAIPEWGTPALIVEILADGYRKEVFLPVDFIVDGKSQFPREDGKVNPEWM